MAQKNVAYNYSQLESQSEQQPVVQTSTNEPSATEFIMMRRAAGWVFFLSFLQLAVGIFGLLGGGFLLFVVSVVFASFGIAGARKRNVRLLTAHFVYSLALYILTLIGIVIMIVYCHYCSFLSFLISFFFLILQAVGMRHSRILIGLLKMYPQHADVRCARRCNRKQQVTAVPTEVATQTPVATETTVQQPQQVPIQFYPQVFAVPPQYVRYPVMGQNAYPMMPMQMQPYVPPFPMTPIPPQDNNNNTPLYPTVPGVYRQV
eukprot:TRINITY_DN5592_c0_g1_i1.p1 TRINITY_DN5592_c0_g1~~TRINITY_DN5592_c0_g1_i1.p1  ORF type:complete len:268 (-),score=109.30 TRINITY_DN5592_c0_g1_i1:44-826(-)